jgi:hypothetical protein
LGPDRRIEEIFGFDFTTMRGALRTERIPRIINPSNIRILDRKSEKE